MTDCPGQMLFDFMNEPCLVCGAPQQGDEFGGECLRCASWTHMRKAYKRMGITVPETRPVGLP